MDAKTKEALDLAIGKTTSKPSAQRRSEFKGTMVELLDMLRYLGQHATTNFTLDGDNIYTYTNALRWIAALDGMRPLNVSGDEVNGDITRGLLITGGTGTGKSLLIRLLRTLSTAIHTQHLVYDPVAQREVWTDFLWADRHAIEYVSEYNTNGYISNMNAAVVCIQDLGAEPKEGSFYGKKQNVIEQLISYRYDKQDGTRRTTIITTNLSLEDIRKEYGERISSRLIEECNILQLLGSDRRIIRT